MKHIKAKMSHVPLKFAKWTRDLSEQKTLRILPVDINWIGVTSQNSETLLALFDEFEYILNMSVKNLKNKLIKTFTPRRRPSVFSLEAFLAHLKMRLVSFFEASGVEIGFTSFTCSRGKSFKKFKRIEKRTLIASTGLGFDLWLIKGWSFHLRHFVLHAFNFLKI